MDGKIVYIEKRVFRSFNKKKITIQSRRLSQSSAMFIGIFYIGVDRDRITLKLLQIKGFSVSPVGRSVLSVTKKS
jgi:hypothetical protein